MADSMTTEELLDGTLAQFSPEAARQRIRVLLRRWRAACLADMKVQPEVYQQMIAARLPTLSEAQQTDLLTAYSLFQRWNAAESDEDRAAVQLDAKKHEAQLVGERDPSYWIDVLLGVYQDAALDKELNLLRFIADE